MRMAIIDGKERSEDQRKAIFNDDHPHTHSLSRISIQPRSLFIGDGDQSNDENGLRVFLPAGVGYLQHHQARSSALWLRQPKKSG